MMCSTICLLSVAVRVVLYVVRSASFFTAFFHLVRALSLTLKLFLQCCSSTFYMTAKYYPQ